MWKFLEKTNFNPLEIDPIIVRNSDKVTYETKWKGFKKDCEDDVKQGFKVNAMIYGSSHGNSF